MTVTRYEVGDKVVVTPECIERMRSSNRSCVMPGYPTQTFINMAGDIAGQIGEVTHTFKPGYEVTARFGDFAFHMKDNWIERAAP